ncbi:hypothetical protein MATL_G00049820 [Megalops atlanticus]|uniref:TNFR-Cys domain-containing protein n=1 Tax=Megalops atlanticus TaxID=7932 RepID=A0A9D3TF06_MEGAT|nr:hypothetical protein MATL_G00049820 [Megalops atlanticus]
MDWTLGQNRLSLLTALMMGSFLVLGIAEDPRECREQEFKDKSGNCVPCRQCGAGQELSEECGFGYGEDARCVPCRLGRFKEDRGMQKCKPCLDCAHVNRFQKANCSTTGNAVCGACLPGFYRKTKLSGFQDMECIPCGDPPPPYEPHCGGRINLVPVPATVTSPRDMALAAVICSALASVLLALIILCVIYCKRQLLEKKPTASVRSQDSTCNGAELSCFDRRQFQEFPRQSCCRCHRGLRHTCGPVPLIPSLCCEETCSLERSCDACPFHSQGSLAEGLSSPADRTGPVYLGPFSDPSATDTTEAWPLVPNSASIESLDWTKRPLEDVEVPQTDSTVGSIQEGVFSREDSPIPEAMEVKADQPTNGQGHQGSSSLEEVLPQPQFS